MIVAGLILAGCGGGDDGERAGGSSGREGGPGGKVREPAVAGTFYPKDPDELTRVVDRLLMSVASNLSGRVRAVIAPHAGYRFSGLTAAAAYKQLMAADVQTVVVLAPSHTSLFDGASIPDVAAYRTPLGLVRLSPMAADLAKEKPFVVNPECDVRRPSWWKLAPKEAPPFGQDTPHTWEHSIEVQLPFLQRTLRKFQLVPVVCGRVDAAELARALSPRLDDRTVVVASSDLSHYKPYDVAKSLDAWCVKAVQELDLKAMARQEACGRDAILAVMHLAKERGWKPVVLDYRNSGDIPNGDKSRVVGYMAVVFLSKGEKKPEEALTPAERELLLGMARRSVTNAAGQIPPPTVDRLTLSRKLLKPKGAFVTLQKDGKLRGCIGYTLPAKPLYQAVIDGAAGAAVRDRRFPPVRPDELDKIVIDISILTAPKPVYYNEPSDLLKRLRPGVDGVVLILGPRQAVYLPAVWKEITDPEDFMRKLSRKAGLSPDAWRQPSARILTFQVEEFKEARG